MCTKKINIFDCDGKKLWASLVDAANNTAPDKMTWIDKLAAMLHPFAILLRQPLLPTLEFRSWLEIWNRQWLPCLEGARAIFCDRVKVSSMS